MLLPRQKRVGTRARVPVAQAGENSCVCVLLRHKQARTRARVTAAQAGGNSCACYCGTSV